MYLILFIVTRECFFLIYLYYTKVCKSVININDRFNRLMSCDYIFYCNYIINVVTISIIVLIEYAYIYILYIIT